MIYTMWSTLFNEVGLFLLLYYYNAFIYVCVHMHNGIAQKQPLEDLYQNKR